MLISNQISFHDSWLINATRQGSSLVLSVETYTPLKNSDSGVLVTTVSIVIENTLKIFEENIEKDEFLLEEKDGGDLYVFHILDNKSVEMVVEWNNFSTKQSCVKSYVIEGEKVVVKVVGTEER